MRGALLALLACVGGCSTRPAPDALAPVVAEPLPATASAGAILYRIDTAHSQLRVLVHRGGTLAALGHNHVIVDDQIRGWIRAGAKPQASAFYLEFAPEDFQVDAPAARAEEGEDFAEPVDEEAREGTRRNMLRAGQLDAAHYPEIRVRSVAVQRVPGAQQATLEISIAGQNRLLTLPFATESEGEVLTVHADFGLRQTELGLTPLSVLLGALQVDDALRLKLQLRAVRYQPAPAP